MKSEKVIVWAVGAIAVAVLLGLTCAVRSCAERSAQRDIDLVKRAVGGVASMTTGSGPEEPSIVLPGKTAGPTRTRRPVFGTERTEGTELIVGRHTDEHGLSQTDTAALRLKVRPDGSVQNQGKETLSVSVMRVSPPWIQWDPSFGFAVMVGQDHPDYPVLQHVGPYALDAAIKGKLIDLPVFRTGIEVGLPCVYFGTAGPGVGLDLKHHLVERLALDGAYWPLTRTFSVGASVNL